jgi:hypothetical protein
MNCKHTKQAVKSLIWGQKADIESIHEHLEVCARCRRRYEPFLTILRSVESVPSAQLDEGTWGKFSASLRSRIRQEQPVPFGRWRSLLLWARQWKLMRFRKALAASAVAVVLATSAVAFLPQLLSGPDRLGPIAQESPTGPARPLPDLPPAALEAISIFRADGFITGVFAGYIRPGDVYGGLELNQDDIVRALDYLLS